MFSISKDLIIRCNDCGKILIIDKDTLDCDFTSDERPMGAEIEHHFFGECQCECGNNLTYSIFAYEYPVEVFNYLRYECEGGIFKQEPTIDIDYWFDFDEYEENDICEDVQATQQYLEKTLCDKSMSYLKSFL